MSNTGSKRLVSVTPFQGSNLNYGFLTNIDAAQSTQLGQTEVGANPPVGLVVGANSPKPARASRRFATGTVSSFIDVGAIVAAKAQGWRVGKAKLRRGGSTQRTQTVYVTINGIKYAWPMPNATAARIGGLAALGIQVSTGQETDLVFGAESPKPPRATRVVGTGTDTDQISTFYDPSVALPAEWSAVAAGLDPLQAP